MAIIPAGYRLLIKPQEVEEKTAGGIYIPDQVKDKDQAAQMHSTVVAIGKDAFKEYPKRWCDIGDTVLTAKYIGQNVTDPENGEEYRLINDLDVLAVVRS